MEKGKEEWEWKQQEPCTPPQTNRQPYISDGQAAAILDNDDANQGEVTPFQDPNTPPGRYFLRSGNTSTRRNKIGLTNRTTSSNARAGSPTPMARMTQTQQLSAQLAGVTAGRSISSAAMQTKPSNNSNIDLPSVTNEIVSIKAAEWHLRARRAKSPAECLNRLFVTPTNEITVYDGFNTTWLIPTDTRLPCPPEKRDEQMRLYQRSAQFRSFLDDPNHSHIRRAMWKMLEKEAEEHCTDEWDSTLNAPLATKPKVWKHVQQTITGVQLIDMVTRKRLREFQVLLPGYFKINIVYITPEGQLTMMEQHIPHDVSMDALLSHLDIWDPPRSLDNEHAISIARFKTTTILDSAQGSSGELRKDGRRVRTHLFRPFYSLDAAGSERYIWSFRLPRSGQARFNLASKTSDVRLWKRLMDEAAMKTLQEGAHAGKIPILARKLRLKVIWPQIEDLLTRSARSHPLLGKDDEFTPEQLARIDELLSERTEQEKKSDREMAAIVGLI